MRFEPDRPASFRTGRLRLLFLPCFWLNGDGLSHSTLCMGNGKRERGKVDVQTMKERIRREIAKRRGGLEFQWMEASNGRIAENFQTLEAFQTSETVALYMAIGGEVDLEPLFSKCWKLGKRTCIPVFNAESKIYEMALVSAQTHYRTGHYGIREPLSPTLLPMDRVDLVAVPGAAFDRAGNRLGRGGGYYDRLLDGFSGVSAAVAFAFQVFPQIPCEAHDRPVDALVTETGIVNF